MLLITKLSEEHAIAFLLAVLYWVVDKKIGIFVYFCFWFNWLINFFLKATFCVYRPFVRSNLIHPVKGAIAEATGYSFPSGHTCRAISVYGGLSIFTSKWIKAILYSIVFFVLLSRMYLGVHTPQDVLVALLVGFIGIYVVKKFFVKLEKNPNYDKNILIYGLLVTALLLIYIIFKKYPMDYVDGKIIYDPKDMICNSIKSIVGNTSIIIAWYLERKFVNFEVNVSNRQKLNRLFVGFFILGIMNFTLFPWLETYGYIGKAILYFLGNFYVLFFAPLIFKWMQKRGF
ncbi:MAG: phosphatase PAP2 family protein [Alphaproteobacteria bacterium]|nr:phosphatase PAP2 family protein [Alphaproteobacteria bacterium]